MLIIWKEHDSNMLSNVIHHDALSESGEFLGLVTEQTGKGGFVVASCGLSCPVDVAFHGKFFETLSEAKRALEDAYNVT